MLDLTVDDVHTDYVFAGDLPVLVHNCPTGTGGGGSSGGGGSRAAARRRSGGGGGRAARQASARQWRRLLQRMRDGDTSAREEFARLTRGEYTRIRPTPAPTPSTPEREEDDLFEPGSRSPAPAAEDQGPGPQKATVKEKGPKKVDRRV